MGIPLLNEVCDEQRHVSQGKHPHWSPRYQQVLCQNVTMKKGDMVHGVFVVPAYLLVTQV
jgi:hypothetical protein